MNVFNLIHLPHHHKVSSVLSFFLLLLLHLCLRHIEILLSLLKISVCRDTEDWWQLFQSIVSVFDTTSSHCPSLSLDPCCFPLLFLLWGRSARGLTGPSVSPAFLSSQSWANRWISHTCSCVRDYSLPLLMCFYELFPFLLGFQKPILFCSRAQ